jgi:hypothetical protein
VSETSLDDQRTLEEHKAKLILKVQKQLEDHKAGLAAMVQHQRVGADLALTAIRSMILVSGGALIAILTFLGNLWTKSDGVAQQIAHAMVFATGAFTAALCLSLLTAMGGYMSALAQSYRLANFARLSTATRIQRLLAKRAYQVRNIVIVLALVSLTTFVMAACLAVAGLRGVPTESVKRVGITCGESAARKPTSI